MKQCPACKSTYTDDTLSFCLNDGTALIAPSSSSAVTEQMSFGSQPTVENNQPIRVNLQSETPTQLSVPRNTTQTEQQRKSSSPLMLLTIIGLLAAVGIAGTTIAYFAFWKKDNSVTTTSSPTPTTTPVQNNTTDETQALKDKLDKLEKQLSEQKNTKSNSSVPTIPTTTQPTPTQPTPTKTATTARVNSPNDGFLALRSAPSAQSGVQILQIPHGANVSVLGCQGSTTIGGRRGRWCRVNYAGQSGWAYDGFLIY